MFKNFINIISVAALSGCTALPDWSLFMPARTVATPSVALRYDFGWRLSGDRAVAPLQVFDNGRKMWLQFAPDQAVPAIFARTPRGDLPLSYVREGPYAVLPQVWSKLVLRGGPLESFIDRVQDLTPVPAASGLPAGASLLPAQGGETSSAKPPISAVSETRPVKLPVSGLSEIPAAPRKARAAPSVHQDARKMDLAAQHEFAAPVFDPEFTASSFALAPAAGVAARLHTQTDAALSRPAVPDESVGQGYEVSPRDQNLRTALSRWARSTGWTFESDHWAVDADIPIVGSATFKHGFESAVQDLVAATELADRPLQPCFYSNKVLRIVPYAQSCDRTAALAKSS